VDEVGRVTVLTNGTRESTTLLGSAYQVFAPKVREAAKSSRRGTVATWFRGRARQVREFVVDTVALGAPTVAAYQWHEWAGLVATGIAVLVLHWAVERVAVSDVPDR
jgi:hypothetical protein